MKKLILILLLLSFSAFAAVTPSPNNVTGGTSNGAPNVSIATGILPVANGGTNLLLPIANGGTGNSTGNPNFKTLTAIGTQTNSITLNPIYVGTSTNLQIYGPNYPYSDTTGLTTAIGTTVAAAIGSSTPLVIPTPGTYYAEATVNTTFSGVTYAAVQQATCSLYRTNNTPATVTDTTATVLLPIMTTGTLTGPTLRLGPVAYTTGNSTDSLSVYCALSALPAAGNFQVTATHITALRQ